MTTSLAASIPGHTPLSWAEDILWALGAPLSPSNLQVVYSWEFAESGGGGGMWNPLNTTQSGYPGETDYNSSGVKNYVTFQDGIAATFQVLHDQAYSQILFQFRLGNNVQGLVNAITSSIWGTKSLPLMPLPPHTIGVEMQFVASPHVPLLAGRTAAAVVDPNNPRKVALWNGCRVVGDSPVHPGATTYEVIIPQLPLSASLVGIDHSIHKGGPLKGQPDGLGFVVFDNAGDSYDFLWAA